MFAVGSGDGKRKDDDDQEGGCCNREYCRLKWPVDGSPRCLKNDIDLRECIFSASTRDGGTVKSGISVP